MIEHAAPEIAPPIARCLSQAARTMTTRWFNAVTQGLKKADYRADIEFYRTRLTKRWEEGSLKLMRLRHDMKKEGRIALYEVVNVETISVDDIPDGWAPKKGTKAHTKLFRGMQTVIKTTFGKRLDSGDAADGW